MRLLLRMFLRRVAGAFDAHVLLMQDTWHPCLCLLQTMVELMKTPEGGSICLDTNASNLGMKKRNYLKLCRN
jgi:hypothetical protein